MEENIAQTIITQVNEIAINLQNQMNGLQNQMNELRDQMNERMDKFNERMDRMENDLKWEIKQVKDKLNEVGDDARFAREACEGIINLHIPKQEEIVKDHEKRICELENRKVKVVPLF